MSAGQRTILVVEDESDLTDLLRFHLDREGYACRCVSDGETALVEARKQPPGLILLDRMIPGLSGDELAARLRADALTAAIPIIMLTAKAREDDALVGFALGADDYVTKPFSMKVLLARIAALLRRTARAADQPKDEVLVAGPVCVDLARHEVRIDNAAVELTATEMRLLTALVVARGRVLARDQLIDAAIGAGAVVTDRTIDVHVNAVRRKLGAAAGWLQTVRGVGYTFREPPVSQGAPS